MVNDIMVKYLDKLNIDPNNEEVVESGEDSYKIVLKDSNEFAKYYSKLDTMSGLDFVEGDLSLQEEVSKLLYINDEISISLNARFADNVYYIELEER